MGNNQLAVNEECVEPELISPGGRGPAYERPRPDHAPAEKPGLLTRLKMLIAGGLALLAIGLFLSGALLTSTFIGAVIGIPLMLAGAVVFFLLFKLLTFGARSPIVFRRF
ncbi:MAG: hypothetical protein A2X35_11260 [Elusimicrobia bacterium GWA2_61_42]|nr:MAG: hypothetical protein A2X35_11260 [Elusimicrobia bacterium GWA2_61_42]OGR75882.1 MAG: hypothetical protein A2X38_07655 [Elusimicrobia bacterium GWC2_61_25]